MVERSGLEMLRPRERRSPRMPNQTNPLIEARVLAFAIAHPVLGPRRISATLAQARDKGYVETLFQRRRTFENINNPNRNLREFSERAAVNAPIQGSASDLIKLAMIRIQRWIESENLPIRMLLQVHDELVFEMPEDQVSQYLPEVLRQMEEVYTLNVPLRVDAHSGTNWMEAK